MPFKYLLAASFVLFIATVTQAQAQVRIGVITSSTGAMSTSGTAQKNTVPLLTARTGELTVQYIYMDDASNPGKSVSAVKKLISEANVDAIIGPSGAPNATALVPVVAQAGIPLLTLAGNAELRRPMTEQNRWVFSIAQNDELLAGALVERMASMKIRTVACLGTNDAHGENWARVFASLARKNNISVVTNERYQRSDRSVKAQALKITAARPDAVMIAAAGNAAVLPQTALYDQGYRGQVFQTQAAALPSFIEQGGEKVEGTIVAASPMLAQADLDDSNPSKKIAQDYIAAYENINTGKPDGSGAAVYDAGLLLERAIPEAAKKARPGTKEFRKALREALEKTSDVAGIQGVYNMAPGDHNGLDFRGRLLVTVKDGQWRLLK